MDFMNLEVPVIVAIHDLLAINGAKTVHEAFGCNAPALQPDESQAEQNEELEWKFSKKNYLRTVAGDNNLFIELNAPNKQLSMELRDYAMIAFTRKYGEKECRYFDHNLHVSDSRFCEFSAEKIAAYFLSVFKLKRSVEPNSEFLQEMP
ncbi:hypothetical protein V6259_12885 [Marinomonas sp. TI.3.20]|uniref:hypothetical protein n=1 Tax=Marinomonas sp. TI.3.20 TaxID=3121296 RepID=UPI00311F3BDC